MGKGSKTRHANGFVSAAVVVFFFAHGVLGCTALLFGFFGSLAWLVWAGVALIALHVVLSVATSYEQLTDAQRPPSPRKKRHLALKWVTGIVLAVCIAAHIALKGAVPARVALVALAVALAVHICVGSKSLLTDLNLDRRNQTLLKVVACGFAALFVLVALAGLVNP